MIIESHNRTNKIVKYFIRHLNMNIKVFCSMCSNTFVNQYTFVFVENLSDKMSCLTIETIVTTVFYSLLEGIAANQSSRGKFEIRTYAFFLKIAKKFIRWISFFPKRRRRFIERTFISRWLTGDICSIA